MACDVPGHEGACSLVPDGSQCGTGNECVHGGCFKIGSVACTTCRSNCDGCAGSIDGTGNYLCVILSASDCAISADCPQGQACSSSFACVMPC